MSRGSPKLTAARKEEIIAACAKLYETMSFREITIKEIGAATSFTRTSIYNYFETKEEIFLALLQKEYEIWVDAMNAVMARQESMTRDELADTLARSLTDRPRLLRLLSMNLYDMEANSRPECLTEFKTAFGASLDAVTRMLEKYVPQMDGNARQQFLYAFFPFIYGIYPYTSVTEKQKAAMEEAGLKEPVFADERGTFSVTLFNTPKEACHDAAPLTPAEQELLTFLETPRTRQEIADHLGIETISYALQAYVAPLIRSGMVEMTIPETPRSHKQRYVRCRSARQ